MAINFGTSTPAPFEGRDYNTMVQTSLESFMDPNSAYMQQAAQQGMNLAAERGGINSSIAAGASQKAALESAMPLVQTSIAAQLNQEQARLDDWVNTQGFNREMASMPFQNSMNMLNMVTQAGIQDPALYTPNVISGFNNFYNQAMNDMMEQYFAA